MQCALISYSLVWHFLRIIGHELAFENNASILGGICQNLCVCVGGGGGINTYYRSVVSHKHTHTQADTALSVSNDSVKS